MYHDFQTHLSLPSRLLSSSGIRALTNAKNAKNAENPKNMKNTNNTLTFDFQPKFYAELEYSG